jgi:hypothetical protein
MQRRTNATHLFVIACRRIHALLHGHYCRCTRDCCLSLRLALPLLRGHHVRRSRLQLSSTRVQRHVRQRALVRVCCLYSSYLGIVVVCGLFSSSMALTTPVTRGIMGARRVLHPPPPPLAAWAADLHKLTAARTMGITTRCARLEAAACPHTVHKVDEPAWRSISKALFALHLLAMGASPCPRSIGQMGRIVPPIESHLLAQQARLSFLVLFPPRHLQSKGTCLGFCSPYADESQILFGAFGDSLSKRHNLRLTRLRET